MNEQTLHLIEHLTEQTVNKEVMWHYDGCAFKSVDGRYRFETPAQNGFYEFGCIYLGINQKVRASSPVSPVMRALHNAITTQMGIKNPVSEQKNPLDMFRKSF